MSAPRRLTVTSAQDGLRLDLALTELGDGWTRSRIRRWIDEGRVLRNGRPTKRSERVTTGDVLDLEVPEIVPSENQPEDIPLSILFEDEHLLVIDKPAGLVIHPAAGNPTGTLVNALLHHCRDLSGIGGVERPGIVHRLDKDTTGVLIVAKNDRTHMGLSLAFSRREIDKTYIAVCYGAPARDEDVIEAPIGRHPVDRKKMTVREDGSPARTLFTVREHLVGTTVLACRLITGRTHQIRVHCAHIGHAIVGDPLYAGRQWKNIDDPDARTACKAFPRQALHARRIAFVHPVTDRRIEVEAPLPGDMAGLLEALRPTTET